jgi:hypothetical protein
MKFLSINTYPVEKLSEAAIATDKLAKNPPKDYKILATYGCMGNPFPGAQLPPGTIIAVSIIESDNAESLASASLEMLLAGVNVNRVPIIDISPGKAEETTGKMKI